MRSSVSANWLRISPAGVACCLTAGLVNSVFYSLMPVFLSREGYHDNGRRHVCRGDQPGGAGGAGAGRVPVGPAGAPSGRHVRAGVIVRRIRSDGVSARARSFRCSSASAACSPPAPRRSMGWARAASTIACSRGQALAATSGLLVLLVDRLHVRALRRRRDDGAARPVRSVRLPVRRARHHQLFVCARMLRRREVPREQRTSFVPGPAVAPAHLAELAAHGGRPADPELPLPAEAVS